MKTTKEMVVNYSIRQIWKSCDKVSLITGTRPNRLRVSRLLHDMLTKHCNDISGLALSSIKEFAGCKVVIEESLGEGTFICDNDIEWDDENN